MNLGIKSPYWRGIDLRPGKTKRVSW